MFLKRKIEVIVFAERELFTLLVTRGKKMSVVVNALQVKDM
jgi:hypothetical protein